MNREKQLVKNTAIITIGKISTQLITFLLLPLYTSILSTEEYGIVDLLNTLVNFCLPIVTLQIEQAIFRYLIEARNQEKKEKEIITTSIFTVVLQIIIYVLIYCCFSMFINNDYKYFLLTNVIACIMSSIMLQIARGLGDNKRYAVGSFIIASLIIVFNVIFITLFRWGAYGMLLANLFSHLIGAIYLFIAEKIANKISYKLFDKDVLKKLLKYSIPLIPNAISWWILNASDRIIITYLISASATGILSLANKFPSVYMTAYNIFNMAWTESVALYIKDKDSEEYISKISNIIFNLFSSMALGIIAIIPFVFNIFINEKFKDSYYLIPILMVAAIFNMLIGLISVIYVAKKDTKAIAKTSFLTAIINIIIDLSLVNFIGVYAATISTLIAYMLMAIYRYYDVSKKYVKIKLNNKNLSVILIIGIIVILAYYTNVLFINVISLIICIIGIIALNKNSIIIIKEFIINKFKGKKINEND